jgi:menaquinone-dependent protoporphyrinogen oxidase
MSNKILVTYASRAGSTAGIAEAIGQTLAESGAQVEVRPMQEVTDLEPYHAVVAGSAIQEGKWLPEAMQFIQTHRAVLNRKPFAAFLVCMTMAIKNVKAREGVTLWMEPVRVLVKPLREGYFAGALNLSNELSFRQQLMFRLSVALGVWAEGDQRDWNAIRVWATDLKPILGV